MMPGYGGMGGWGLLMMFGGTILLIVLIGLGVWLLSRAVSGGPGMSGPTAPSGREILDDRYARGEIDEDEYRKRLAVLSGK